MMSFKKYVISMIICAVVLFTTVFGAFVPIDIYASDSWAIDWFGTELWTDKKNNLQSEDVYYLQVYYNRTYSLRGFSISPSKVEKVSLNEYYDKITLTFDNVPKNGYFINNYVYSSGIIVYSGRTSTSQKVLEYTSSKNMSYSSEKVEEEDTSFFGRLWQGLKNMWYSDKDSTIDFLFFDDNVIDYWNKIGDDWCDFVKTVLDIDDSDTSTLNSVMTDIYNNDYSRDYWTNIDTNKITQIRNTSNNIKQFWNNNVTVVNDGDNNYHYEIKNFNTVTNTYPNYLYDNNYFYNNILYPSSDNIDLSNIYEYLNKISFKLDTIISNTDIYNILSVIDTQFNNTSLGLMLTNIDTKLDANFNALGGVIAGAINTAWADIKGELKLLIEGINFRFGDISIGDSTSSDDDTSTTNKIKINFDSLVDKLNIKLKGLFDDLKVSLDDLFSDIHITIDKDNTKDNPDTPTEPVEDDFWKDLCNIIKNKIPLFGQCVELLEPITNTCIDDINTNHLISDSHSSFLLTQQYSVCSYYSIDGQLEFDTPIVTNFFDGLISIKQSADNSVVFLGVSLNGVQYYGYTFSGFWLDISYYYNNYRVKLSNLLLFFCYIGFAFSVIHRTSKLFGYSSSSNDG